MEHPCFFRSARPKNIGVSTTLAMVQFHSINRLIATMTTTHNPTSNMSGEEQDVDYPLPDYAMIDASGYEVNDKSCIQPRSHGEILTEAGSG